MSNRIFQTHIKSNSDLPKGVVRRKLPLIIDEYNQPNLIKVKDFNPDNYEIIRTGVIVYSYNYSTKQYYFYMGEDKNSNDLTDFGGGCRKEQDPIESALRELKEESKGVFGNYNTDQIQDCIMAYTNGMLIIFIPLIVDYPKLKHNFDSIKSSNQYRNEIKDIIRLDKTEFIQAIYSNKYKMYVIVKKFLQGMLVNNTNFFQKL